MGASSDDATTDGTPRGATNAGAGSVETGTKRSFRSETREGQQQLAASQDWLNMESGRTSPSRSTAGADKRQAGSERQRATKGRPSAGEPAAHARFEMWTVIVVGELSSKTQSTPLLMLVMVAERPFREAERSP